MRSSKEILEAEARKEKGVYMDQASYQEGVVLRAIETARREALGAAAKVIDDARWVEFDKGPDDRLGDGSPSVLAYAAHLVRNLNPMNQNPTNCVCAETSTRNCPEHGTCIENEET